MRIYLNNILLVLLLICFASCKKSTLEKKIVINHEGINVYPNDTLYVDAFAFFNQKKSEFIQIIIPLSMHNRDRIEQNEFFLQYNKELYKLDLFNFRKINNNKVLYTLKLSQLEKKYLNQFFNEMKSDNEILLQQKFSKIIKKTKFFLFNKRKEKIEIPYTNATRFFVYYTNALPDDEIIILE